MERYTISPSALGTFTITWQETEEGPRINQISLPDQQPKRAEIPGPGSHPHPISELCEQIKRFLQGEEVLFDMDIMNLEGRSKFQRRVLSAQRDVPRGQVTTYGRIAKKLGNPKGARAVGGALARNPFPIVIPCHRTIRSSGEIGGFGGGQNLKRALLELEEMKISKEGKILTDWVY